MTEQVKLTVQESRKRNWLILRLRGMHTLAIQLGNEIILEQVKLELTRLGAKL
jgi:hypothetical protein